MAADSVLPAADLQLKIDQRLDEVDRALLGLLPRGERLAIMANVEARVRAQGDDVSLALETSLPATTGSAVALGSPTRNVRRSRLAFTSGVVGIVAAASLVASPLLIIGSSLFGEALGDTFAIVLMSVFTVILTLAGGWAVCVGFASILRLSRRGQTTCGTGWAITGLCTGLLPMLIGGVTCLAIATQMAPDETFEVTWNTTAQVPVTYSGVPPYGDLPQMLPEAPPALPMSAHPLPPPLAKPTTEMLPPLPPSAEPQVKPALKEEPGPLAAESVEIED